MRLPRKTYNKIRTLHVCFVCELMNCCVMACMPCFMYDDGLCASDYHKEVLESFGVLQFVKLEKENKLNKFLLIYLVYRIMK